MRDWRGGRQFLALAMILSCALWWLQPAGTSGATSAGASGRSMPAVKIPKTTKVLTKSGLKNLIHPSNGRPFNGTAGHLLLRFRHGNAMLRSLRPGDVVVVPPSAAAPRGMLRRVLKVVQNTRPRRSATVASRRDESGPSPDWTTEVDTSSASLKQTLGHQDILVSTSVPGPSWQDHMDLGAGVSGDASFSISTVDVYFHLNADDQHFYLTLTPHEQARFTVTGSAGVSGSLDKEIALPSPLKIPVAPGIAIFINASFQMHVDYDVHESLSESLVQTAAGSACAWYESNGWGYGAGHNCVSAVHNTNVNVPGTDFAPDVHIEPQTPTLEKAADFTLTAGPHLEFLLENLVGPDVGLDAYAHFHSDGATWTLQPGLRVPASIQANFLVAHKTYGNRTLLDWPINPPLSGTVPGYQPPNPNPTPSATAWPAGPPTPTATAASPDTPTPTATEAPPAGIVPGGVWISPNDGDSTNGVIHFAAHAYPTNPGDPPIDHVNFTLRPPSGSWQIGCTASGPSNGDVYSCDADLSQLGAPPGPIQVSFDVYDTQGNYNLSPNGERTVNYQPPVSCGTTVGQQCTAIWTDQSQYNVGDSAQICYSVPFPAYFQIVDTEADGTTNVIDQGNDDGSGGCFNVTVTTPTGTETVELDVYQNGSVYQSAVAQFQVMQPSSGGGGGPEAVQLTPTNAQAGQLVQVAWQDDGDDSSPTNITVSFDGQTIATGQASDDATWSGTIAIPTDASVGDHTITVSDDEGSSFNASFAVTGPGSGAAIWADQSQYTVGSPVSMCYIVPGPSHVVITDTDAGGNAQTVLDGNDDGTGGCLSGTATAPTGTEDLNLAVYSLADGSEIASEDFDFQVN